VDKAIENGEGRKGLITEFVVVQDDEDDNNVNNKY
jgi:hypothetical protein